MANDKRFVTKNGLHSQNILMVDDVCNPSNSIEISMDSTDTISFIGDSGQLFSVTDSLSGTIFAVNDISGIPSIEVDDDGTIRFAENTGNVLIGTATDNGTDKVQISGSLSVTSYKAGTTAVIDSSGNWVGNDLDWGSQITGKPTTLSGYGITDGATTSYVTTQISNLVASAPTTLDTLNELAAALGDDPNFATTVTNSIATKAASSITISAGGGLTGGGNLTANRTISHADTSSATNLTASARRYVTGLTFDGYGHVTGYTTGTETVVNTDTNTTSLPVKNPVGTTQFIATDTSGIRFEGTGITTVSFDVATQKVTFYTPNTNTDTNNYVTGLSWNTTNGVLTATRSGLTSLEVDLDGRYQLAGSYLTAESDTLSSVTARGATHSTSITPSANVSYSLGSSTLQYEQIFANTFVGDLNGTAEFSTTAFYADSAATASNVYVERDDATNATRYLTFVDSSTAGNQRLNMDSNFYYNPLTNTLTATNFAGTATYAKYADVAERYETDGANEAGTIMVFGGDKEVTASTKFAQTKVAGVISDKPAFAMNSEAGSDETHPYIALQGRVPCKVVGKVRKGDIIVASEYEGVGQSWSNEEIDPRMTAYVGIAIADKDTESVGLIEVKVGK